MSGAVTAGTRVPRERRACLNPRLHFSSPPTSYSDSTHPPPPPHTPRPLLTARWDGGRGSDAARTTGPNVRRSAIGDSGGEQRLIKTLPRKGFRFVGQVREAREVAGPNPGDAPESAPAVPDKPSIAVLPFAN